MNIHVLWHNDPQNWKLSPFLKVVKSPAQFEFVYVENRIGIILTKMQLELRIVQKNCTILHKDPQESRSALRIMSLEIYKLGFQLSVPIIQITTLL